MSLSHVYEEADIPGLKPFTHLRPALEASKCSHGHAIVKLVLAGLSSGPLDRNPFSQATKLPLGIACLRSEAARPTRGSFAWRPAKVS